MRERESSIKAIFEYFVITNNQGCDCPGSVVGQESVKKFLLVFVPVFFSSHSVVGAISDVSIGVIAAVFWDLTVHVHVCVVEIYLQGLEST